MTISAISMGVYRSVALIAGLLMLLLHAAFPVAGTVPWLVWEVCHLAMGFALACIFWAGERYAIWVWVGVLVLAVGWELYEEFYRHMDLVWWDTGLDVMLDILGAGVGIKFNRKYFGFTIMKIMRLKRVRDL